MYTYESRTVYITSKSQTIYIYVYKRATNYIYTSQDLYTYIRVTNCIHYIKVTDYIYTYIYIRVTNYTYMSHDLYPYIRVMNYKHDT